MPPLPSAFDLWLVNRFGDAFIVPDEGSVHWLDLGRGSFTKVADSRAHFAQLLDTDDNANIWLMISLVDRCVRAGMYLAANQCYGFKIPPNLGGTYDLENIEIADLGVQYGLLAQIYRQTRDLPDGTPVKVVTSN